MQLYTPAALLVRELERKEPRIDARTDPIALVRLERFAFRLVAHVEESGFGIVDTVDRDEEVDVGHSTNPRLLEIGVRRVESLEDDRRDPARDERVDRDEHLTRNALRPPAP